MYQHQQQQQHHHQHQFQQHRNNLHHTHHLPNNPHFHTHSHPHFSGHHHPIQMLPPSLLLSHDFLLNKNQYQQQQFHQLQHHIFMSQLNANKTSQVDANNDKNNNVIKAMVDGISGNEQVEKLKILGNKINTSNNGMESASGSHIKVNKLNTSCNSSSSNGSQVGLENQENHRRDVHPHSNSHHFAGHHHNHQSQYHSFNNGNGHQRWC